MRRDVKFISIWSNAFTDARSILLIYLCTALGGVWSLEQPSGALTEFYPAFREMLTNMFENGGPMAVGSQTNVLVRTRVYSLFIVFEINDMILKCNHRHVSFW